MNKTSLIFFGSSVYSVIILKKLVSLKDFSIVTIVTKPDKAIGRNQQISSNPVATFAKKHHLPLLQPTTFNQAFIKKYQKLKPDLALCVAYGPPFFDQNMIDIPTYKIVNIHPSALPKYRGATPGPWQIINGIPTSAVSFFQIDTLPDHGPIIAQIPFDIKTTWTSHDFYQHAFTLASQHLDKILKKYIKSPNLLTPQDHSQKSYYPKFNKQTAKINWSWSAPVNNRFVKAMNPWPIAWTKVKNSKNKLLTMKVFSAKLKDDQMVPVQVQIEGKTKTNWTQIKDYYQIDI